MWLPCIFRPSRDFGKGIGYVLNAINILSLTGHLPCMIHKFAQKRSFVLVRKTVLIFSFETLFLKKSLKPGRIIQDL